MSSIFMGYTMMKVPEFRPSQNHTKGLFFLFICKPLFEHPLSRVGCEKTLLLMYFWRKMQIATHGPKVSVLEDIPVSIIMRHYRKIF